MTTNNPSNPNDMAFEEKSNQSSEARTAEIDSNPNISLEEARNANEGKEPNASGGPAPSTAEEQIPGRSESDATDIASSNTPR
jgi:hypothetical protein